MQQTSKERTKSSMSRISNGNGNGNGNGATEQQIDEMIIDDTKYSDYGLRQFRNPCIQACFERAQEEYKKKFILKNSYDKQEFLRRMRTDIKREYLTRKRQLKKLQTDAAVAFREAERSLQEHYSTVFAESQGRRTIDINMPLVHDISLPDGRVLDLKNFNIERAFNDLVELHHEYYQNERESAIEFIRRSDAYHERKQRDEEEWDRQQQQQQQQQSSCENHYKDPRDDCGKDCGDLHCQVCSFVREQHEEWKQQQRECGNESDSDSYDSSYCAEFGYYPREYNYEREIREAEEAREAAAEQQRREENARDVDGELADKKDPREIPWAEWVAGGHVSEKCLGCDDLECSDCYSYGNGSVSSYDSSYCADFGYPRVYNYERECREREEAEESARAAHAARQRAEEEAEQAAEKERRRRWEEMSLEEEQRIWFENTRNSEDELWDEEAIAVEAEYRREIAEMKHGKDTTYACDDDDDDDDHPKFVAIKASVASTSTRTGTSKDICARKKAASKSSAAAAMKARIAKQQQKKLKKFIPIQITLNDNRSRHEDDEEATATLSRSKLEINLPKKNLQGASREAMKRYNKKWNRVNAQAKQTSARGCGIANLPDPNNPRYGNESE
jgi:hypothetical protein